MAKRGVKSQKNFKMERGSFRHKKTWSNVARRVDNAVKKHYGDDRGFFDEERNNRHLRVENQLVLDVFGYVDPTEKASNRRRNGWKERVRELYETYKDYDIFYAKSKEDAPDGAICADKGNIYLFRGCVSMTLDQFLSYFIGDNFLSQDKVCAALSEWSGIPRGKIHEAYLDVVWFFKRQNEIKNMNSKRELETPNCHQGYDVTNNYVNNGTVNNYNYFATTSPVEP